MCSKPRKCEFCKQFLVQVISNGLKGLWICPNKQCPRGWLLLEFEDETGDETMEKKEPKIKTKKVCVSCETELVQTIDDSKALDGHVTCPNTDCPRGWLLTTSYNVEEMTIEREAPIEIITEPVAMRIAEIRERLKTIPRDELETEQYYVYYKEDVRFLLNRFYTPYAEEGDIRLFKDGDQWCALKGPNLQEGIAGFGNTMWDALGNMVRNQIKESISKHPVAKVIKEVTGKEPIMAVDLSRKHPPLILQDISVVEDPPNPHCIIEGVESPLTVNLEEGGIAVDLGKGESLDMEEPTENRIESIDRVINREDIVEGVIIGTADRPEQEAPTEDNRRPIVPPCAECLKQGWYLCKCGRRSCKEHIDHECGLDEERDYEGEEGDARYKAEQESKGPDKSYLLAPEAKPPGRHHFIRKDGEEDVE